MLFLRGKRKRVVRTSESTRNRVLRKASTRPKKQRLDQAWRNRRHKFRQKFAQSFSCLRFGMSTPSQESGEQKSAPVRTPNNREGAKRLETCAARKGALQESWFQHPPIFQERSTSKQDGDKDITPCRAQTLSKPFL
jgi:hypothetical protein